MGHLLISLILAVIALFAPPPISRAQAADDIPSEVVARVNGVVITRNDIMLVERDLFASMGHMVPQERDRAAINHLIDRLLAAAAAEQEGLADDPEVMRRLHSLRYKVLQDVYVSRRLSAEVTKAMIDDYYHREIHALPEIGEVRARHILVDTRSKAQRIHEDLMHGGDFIALAKQHSQDPSGRTGGDLGYFPRGAMLPPFATAAFALAKGGVSLPVRTRFGWHIIRVEDKRVRPPPPLSEVREQIINVLLPEARHKLYNKLRTNADIEIMPAYRTAPQ